MIQVGWELEEMVALVDLYMQTKNAKSSVRNFLIDKLSIKLRRRAEMLDISHDERYRNHNGLVMMLMNLRSIDTSGITGLSSTSKLMSDVWEMYHKDKTQFKKILLEFNRRYEKGNLDSKPRVEANHSTTPAPGGFTLDPEAQTSIQSEPNKKGVLTPASIQTDQTYRAATINTIGPTVLSYIQEKNLPLFDSWASHFNLDANQWTDFLLEEMVLSVRAFNCLTRAKIDTIEDLLNLTVCQTASIRGMGHKTFCEIVDRLEALNGTEGKLFASKHKTADHASAGVNEEIKKYRDLILAEDWLALDEMEISSPAKEYIHRIKENCETLGKDLTHSLLQSSSEVLSILSNVREKLDYARGARAKVQSALVSIPKERLDLFVEGLLRAYLPTQTNTQEVLLNCFGGATARLDDIKHNIQQIQPAELSLVLKFLKWCTFDISASLETFMNTVQEKPRNMMILTLRSQDQTLQEVGERCELTRERVRQIEQSIRKHFIAYEKQENLLLKISALRNGDSILTTAEVKPYLGEHADCLLYLLTTIPSSQYTYNRHLHTFMIGCEEVASQVEHFIGMLPEQFKVEEFDDIVERAEVEEGLPAELVRLQMNDVYSRAGTVYHKGRLTLTEMYRQTLRLHYPNGFHIYDEESLAEFKQHVLDEFGQEVKLPDNNRALSARIADIGILCGRGMYRPKADSYISEELAQRIRQYIIDFDSSILLTNTIFAAFKNELTAVGVDNKYYLQGILGELYGEDFIFSRDYISKDANVTSLYSTIVEYIKQYDYPVPKSLLMEHFPGIPEIVMNLATADASVVNFFGEYMHRDRLRLNSTEKEIVRSHLKEFLADGNTHTSRELFAHLNNVIPHILNKGYIRFHFALFSICECWFAEEAQFDRPYLAKNGVELIREEEILLKYLHDTKNTNIDELLEFIQRIHYRADNILEMLDSLNDEYLLADQNSLVSIASSGITEEHCKVIEARILAEITKCTPIRSLVCLYNFPKLSIKWSEWLVYSMLKKWSTRLDVSPSFNQFRFSIPLVAPKGKLDTKSIEQIGMVTAQDDRFDKFEVEDFEDLVADILLEEGDFDDFA